VLDRDARLQADHQLLVEEEDKDWVKAKVISGRDKLPVPNHLERSG
jgi:hypothetical protein